MRISDWSSDVCSSDLDLVISGGKIGISAAALQGRSLSSPLQTIHLKDIGKDKGGASPAEEAQKIIGTISAEASEIAARDLHKQHGTMLKDGAGAAGGTAGGAAYKLKGMLGKESSGHTATDIDTRRGIR